MLQLQTPVNVPNPGFSIDYSSVIMFFGSCFSTNIGIRMENLKFNCSVNPFGVLYNPASIARSVELLLENRQLNESGLQFYNDLWFSFNHHTSFSSASKTGCLDKINQTLQSASDMLRQSDIIFLTLGTSWVFRYLKTGDIVANCHKIPAKEFKREYLIPEKTVEILSDIIKRLYLLNNDLKIILTISPIRHWKDGAIENMRSKAALVLAVKELEKLFAQVYYFPVYEIFMDEMRDYRYYASDMLHPSEFAIEYIWEKFHQAFFTSGTISQLTEIKKFIQMVEHKPVNTASESYRKFIDRMDRALETLIRKYPGIDFSNEKNILSKRS